jgi:hypothetical protein
VIIAGITVVSPCGFASVGTCPVWTSLRVGSSGTFRALIINPAALIACRNISTTVTIVDLARADPAFIIHIVVSHAAHVWVTALASTFAAPLR